jgi:hypothetical protein
VLNGAGSPRVGSSAIFWVFANDDTLVCGGRLLCVIFGRLAIFSYHSARNWDRAEYRAGDHEPHRVGREGASVRESLAIRSATHMRGERKCKFY